jgi:hypothetical protein
VNGVQFVLLLVAAVLFGAATFGFGARFNLIAAGLCLAALAFLLPGFSALT